ncbi:radical SAM family heme chaperone HemW [Dokdonella sp.]|uniref:radical SAM family heme chaperone HemW n=1 Tax=Dokdonella sp. TaxID=2291710 RepID=UPI0031CB5009|nr:radical SAM family heme chaperone HemW [Dokdonella sp.]
MLIAPPLALYIHIPWCVRKCPYCDFNSHAQRGALPVDDYIAALLADLERDLAGHAAAVRGRSVGSIFFGGGTPSLFAADAIARILAGVAARVDVAAGAEITLETNPGTVEHGRFEGYLAAGVNRLSIGVQSFDDDKLARLGRIHSAAEAERAVKSAQDAGYANINLDLMYGLPGQTLAGALADVDQALALAPAHLSHYQLTLEPNTVFAARPPVLPDEDNTWDMQEACQARLAAAGFVQYEVSAYARDGQRCRHNLNYWTFGDYLGIGAGAHGKLSDAQGGTITRTAKVKVPHSYLARAAPGGQFGTRQTIDGAELPFEFMLNALRLVEGVPLALFADRTGVGTDAIAARLADQRTRGWLEPDADRIQPSALGRRFLNDVMAAWLPARANRSTAP